jgi:hypothetical protein
MFLKKTGIAFAFKNETFFSVLSKKFLKGFFFSEEFTTYYIETFTMVKLVSI